MKRHTQREVFEVWLAFVAITTGSFYVFFPDLTSQGVLKEAFAPLWPLDILWNIAWIVGGVLTLIGIWKEKGGDWEQAGLSGIATAVATYSAAIIYVRGTGGLVSVGLNLAIVLACLIRIKVIDEISAAIKEAERIERELAGE